MPASKIKIVFAKEIRDVLHDRSALFPVIIVPLILYPMLFVVMGLFMGRQEADEELKVSAVAVTGTAVPATLEALIKADPRLQLVTGGDPAASMRDGSLQAVAEVSGNLSVPGGSPTVTVLYDEASRNSEKGRERLNGVLEKYKQQVVAQRLAERGIEPQALEPFAVNSRNIASPRKMGGYLLGSLIPHILVMMICLGALHTAMDITAGEKERRTIETLLVSNISRQEIVTGKLLAVIAVGMATCVTALLGLFASCYSGFSLLATPSQMSLGLSPLALAASFLIFLPTAILVSSLLLLVGSFARTLKEGNTYGSLFMMAMVMLAIISTTPFEPSNRIFLIPILNTAFCQKEILLGQPNWHHIVLATGSSVLLAAAATVLAIAVFTREQVLLRQ